ncbi:MAG: hypothetical protein ACKPA7_28595, partial [Sphaerospermopsis kisseleviana]
LILFRICLLHCLVMEKIEGLDLYQYMEQRQNRPKDKSSQQIYQAIGTIIGGVLLIIIRLGWKDISKIFQPQVSQPVAISTPTETQTNNPDQINSEATSQAPPVPNETTYPQIPYGWKKFQGGGASLWLPASYDGSRTGENLNATLRRLKSRGSQWKQIAPFIEENRSIQLFAVDYNQGKSGFLTNVIVLKVQVPTTINLKTYFDEVNKNSPPDIRILDIKTGFAEGYEVAKIIREDSKGVDSKQIIYLIKDGGIVWNVFFSTNADEFETRLPIFEASIRTLSTQP